MDFYQFFTFVTVAYCVVRAIAAKKNPVFWGIFAFFVPWLALIVIHVFTWKTNDDNKKTPAKKNKQDSWERIRKELQERNKRQQNRQNYQEPREKKKPIYDLPQVKPSKKKPLVEYNMPTFDVEEPVFVETEKLAAETVEIPEVEPPKFLDIEVPDFVESEKLHDWGDEKEAIVENAQPVEDYLELKPLEEVKETPVPEVILREENSKEEALIPEVIEEVLPILETVNEEREEKEEEVELIITKEEPIQTKACLIRSYQKSLSGMHKIKYSKVCGHCDWEDSKSFSFLFHESESHKKDNFICPNCLGENDLSIFVSLKEDELALVD